MRISSMQMMGGYLKQLNDSYESQTKLMEQSDGSNLHRPSDDSVRYSKYLRYQTSNNENLQYTANVKRASSWMATADAAIVNITELQKTIVEKTVEAATDTNNEMNVKEIGKEVMGYLQQIVALGNSQQGDRYMFSGQSDLTEPFVFAFAEDQWVDRGLAKTLDEPQQAYFNDADDKGNVTQMLTLNGSDGNTYYLNTLTHKVYAADFVNEGYKEKIAKGQTSVQDGDELYQLDDEDLFSVASYFKNTGEIRTSTKINILPNADAAVSEGTSYDFDFGAYVTNDGEELDDTSSNILPDGTTFIADSAVTIKMDGHTKIIKAGERYTLGAGEIVVAGATLRGENSNLIVSVDVRANTASSTTLSSISPGADITSSFPVSDTEQYVVDYPVSIVMGAGASPITYEAGTAFSITSDDWSVYAGIDSDNDGTVDSWDGSNTDAKDLTVTTITPGDSTDTSNMIPGDKMYLETGNYTISVPVTVTKTDGTTTIYKAGSTIDIEDTDDVRVGVEVDPLGIYGDEYVWASADADDNPAKITFSLETIHQPIVTYQGDAKYISMVKRNGLIDPTADTVNMTGQDIFGSDIFDNVNSGNQFNRAASGTAALNDMLTVWAKMNAADTHWLSSDGITLSDSAHQTTVDAETTVASRQQVYEQVESMLTKQNAIITDDINNVSATDVAKLAVELMAAQTIYNMSLSVGSRILPPTLADYL